MLIVSLFILYVFIIYFIGLNESTNHLSPAIHLQVETRGGKTLVHCVAGVSRSASICIAYLMKYKRMPLDQAYKHVKKCRSVIQPNVGFWKQLIEFERRLFGRTTVKMVQSSGGFVPDIYFQEAKSTFWHPSSSSRYGY